MDIAAKQTDPEEVREGIDPLASLRMIARNIGEQKGQILFAVGLATVSALLDLLPIWVVYKLVVLLVSGDADPAWFWAATAGMTVLIPLSFFTFGMATRASHRVAFNLLCALRLRLARHIARLPMGRVGQMRSGQAKQTMITEPEELELMIAHAIPEGISALISWGVVTLWLFLTDWRLALAAVVLVPIAFVCMGLAIRRSFSDMKNLQRANSQMNAAIVEYLAGMPVIKIFETNSKIGNEATRSVTRLAELQSAMGRSYVPLGGTFYALILANITVIMVVGVWLLAYGETDLVTLVFFVILGANYATPLMRLFDLFHHFAHISLAATTAQDILSQPPQLDTGAPWQMAPQAVGQNLTFEDVSFGYAGRAVLNNISLTAPAGSVTALIGPSGAGKSTLAALIPRLHDVDSGCITLGGTDIRKPGLSALMEQVGFVFQDPFLFSDSIAANIRLGRPGASDDEVRAAARAAHADAFITQLPQGYDTMVGAGQQSLSGGERQRIALARTVLKNAPVLVLDEATAFADPDSEAEIQQALSRLAEGRTVIVIAHRLHTIVNADQILVMQAGHIVERGRHSELLAQGGLYARLWQDYQASRAAPIRQGDKE
ncbi:ABC transporter ATP-binding protein [Rhodobacteraceae bacterium R_SAG6]|nr:ABC transporter ATP-binding protein [Rhodobacteraceae bacterium R_SAG6]